MPTRRPTGLRSPKYRRAKLSLTMTERKPVFSRPNVSRSSNSRPAMSLAPSVEKNPGPIRIIGTRAFDARCAVRIQSSGPGRGPDIPATRVRNGDAFDAGHFLQPQKHVAHDARGVRLWRTGPRRVGAKHQQAAAVEPAVSGVESRQRLHEQPGSRQQNERDASWAPTITFRNRTSVPAAVDRPLIDDASGRRPACIAGARPHSAPATMLAINATEGSGDPPSA